MDRLVKTTIAGQPRTLNYSIDVMFDALEKFGNIKDALETLGKNDRKGFETIRWFAVKMANDGELILRAKGYDHSPLLDEKELTLHMAPLEYEALKGAVVEAIQRGYMREVDTDEEVDVGLAELNQKKTKGRKEQT